MKYKICSKCKKRKRLTSFNKCKTGSLGFHNYCRKCDSLNKKKYYAENKEKCLAAGKAWCLRNPERFTGIQRRHKNKYKAYYVSYAKGWAKKNNDKCRLRKHRYLTRMKNQLGIVSPNIIEKLMGVQKELCYYCEERLENWHLEHMTPISRGGLHDDSNLCLACQHCNLSKGAKTAEEFIKKTKEERTWQLM